MKNSKIAIKIVTLTDFIIEGIIINRKLIGILAA